MQNIILISIDCLRADYAGYTEDAKIKPTVLTELAKKGVAYENCIAQAPFTTTSHATMLSGLYPFEHGVRHLYGEKLSESTTMIQHDMKERGYSTHVVVSCFHMTHIGLENGFDSFVFNPTIQDDKHGRSDYNDAKTVTDRAIEILDKDEKTFLFLHYFDAHLHVQQVYEKMYCDEIKNIDEQIGRLVDYCNDDTLFVITGDHGKKWNGEHNFPCLNPRNPAIDPKPCAFNDIGEGGHGAELYDECMRVPLIVYYKIQPRNFSIHKQIQLLNLRDIVRHEVDWSGYLGYGEMFAYMETFSPDQLFKEGIPQIGIRQANEWKLICYQINSEEHKRTFAPAELYNLKEDPRELNNLYDKNSDKVIELFENLMQICSEAAPVIDYRAINNRQIKEKLKALGYV